MRPIALLLCIFFAAGAASADTFWDTSFSYFARDNVGGSDNDIIRNKTGLTVETQGGGWRAEAGLGIRNEYFGGSYPLDWQAAGLVFQDSGEGVWTAGARLSGIEDGDAAAEALLGYTRFWGPITTRGLFGLQYVSGDAVFEGGRGVGGLDLAEVSY